MGMRWMIWMGVLVLRRRIMIRLIGLIPVVRMYVDVDVGI